MCATVRTRSGWYGTRHGGGAAKPLCPRKTFTECLPAVPARKRLTTRLRAECGQLAADTDSCITAAGTWYGVSWPIAHAAYVAHVQPVLEQPLPHVQVLGIDETRRGKPKWAQDPTTGRWQMVAEVVADRDRRRAQYRRHARPGRRPDQHQCHQLA